MRALHDRSRRRTRTLVRVNCAALPPTLVESELFGHEKGAFTGAVSTRLRAVSNWRMEDTIFLDEIGDLLPEIQVKLLRVLQEGEFERVGSSRTKRVNVRVIAATHRDLEADVAAGRFRADLYYRLSVYPIHLPALRERRDDIPTLVWFLIHQRQRELGRRITTVPAGHDARAATSTVAGKRERAGERHRARAHPLERRHAPSSTIRSPALRGRPAAGVDAPGDSLDAIQRTHIEAVLQQSRWRISGANAAAERLGLHPNTLRFRLKKLGIVLPKRRESAAWARARRNRLMAPRRSDRPLTEIGHCNDHRL